MALRTAESGFRSSCPSMARNSSFRRSPSASSSSFPLSSASSRFFSVTSRAIFEAPTIRPSESLIADTVSEMFKSRPSLVMRTVSKWSTISPRRIRESTSSSSAPRSLGMMRVMCRPTASALVQPNIRSAAGFQDVMMPSRDLLTIASSEFSTMAASRAWAISRPMPCASITCAFSCGPTMKPCRSPWPFSPSEGKARECAPQIRSRVAPYGCPRNAANGYAHNRENDSVLARSFQSSSRRMAASGRPSAQSRATISPNAWTWGTWPAATARATVAPTTSTKRFSSGHPSTMKRESVSPASRAT